MINIFESSNKKTNILNAQFVLSLFHLFESFCCFSLHFGCAAEINIAIGSCMVPKRAKSAHLQVTKQAKSNASNSSSNRCTCIVSPMQSHFSSLSQNVFCSFLVSPFAIWPHICCICTVCVCHSPNKSRGTRIFMGLLNEFENCTFHLRFDEIQFLN